MDPSGFRIKKVGEELPKENEEVQSDDILEEVNLAEEVEENTVVQPAVKKENPLRLAHRPGQAPLQDGSPCPQCEATVEREAVMCVSCGFNLKKGKQVKTKHKKASGNPSFPNRNQSTKSKRRGPSALSNFMFYTVILGIIGGGVYYFLLMPALKKADEKRVEALCKVQLKRLGFSFPEELDHSVKCPTSGHVYEFYWPKNGLNPLNSRKNLVLARCFKHYNGVGTDGSVKHFPNREGLQLVGYEQMRDLILGRVKTKEGILKTLNKPFSFEPYNIMDANQKRISSKDFNSFDLQYGTATLLAWREMEAINYGGRGVVIKAKKDAKKLQEVKRLAFKIPEGISKSKIKIILDKEDADWFKKNLK